MSSDAKHITIKHTARGPLVMRDYSLDVGEVFGALTVIGFEKRERPTFLLRCRAGHTFARDAWDTSNGTDHCSKCNGSQRSIKTLRLADIGPSEVCDCQWFNGVQKYACAQHRGAA